MMFKVLSLDLSTTNCGYAFLDRDAKKLLSYGEISPRIKNPSKYGIKKYSYPEYQVLKIRDICSQILELITDDVELIVIEEINRGKARIQQKILDGLHFVLLEKFPEDQLKKVIYIDSDGLSGWRSREGLGLQLSEQDKLINKNRRKINKKLAKKDQLPIITQKHLACKYVNAKFGTSFDVDKRSKDSDVCDAIGLGWCYVSRN